MKRCRTGTVLLVLFAICSVVFFSTGCSSLSALVRSNISGYPYWYYSPLSGIPAGKTAVVGAGSAVSERQAELLAYSDVINQMSEKVGYDLGQEAYRELSVLGTVTQLGLYIADRYSTVQEGHNVVFLHVAVDENLLLEATSPETRMRNEMGSTIESLVLEGDEDVKAGRELKAVENYMTAMLLGYDLDYIAQEYSFDELYSVVMDLLAKLTMTIQYQRPASANCTISLTRKGTFVSSAVSSAEILSSYTATDIRGGTYEDSFIYVTDGNGQFVFNPMNYSIVRSGKVVFSLNLNYLVNALEALAGAEKIAPLKAAIESKTVEFEYSMVYSLGDIAVAVVEHDRLGNVTGVTEVTDYLVAKYRAENAPVAPFYTDLDDEEDILYDFQHSGRTEKCLLVVRVGELGGMESATGRYAASAEGWATLYSCSDSRTLYSSGVVYASAVSDTAEDAVSDSFRTFIDLIYSLVKAVYV